MRTILSIAAVACVAVANAQVVPNVRAATEGDSNFFLFVNGTTTRTYQQIIAASQLTSLVGQSITGLQFRMDGAATAGWPNVSGSMSSFQVTMGQGVAPSAQSTSFASNFTGPTTVVRSGALSFNAGDFSVGGSPNAFGPNIGINNYLYTGGNLTIEYRFNGMTNSIPQPSLDACAADIGQGTDYAAMFATSDSATSGISLGGRFVVTKINAVPEPASMAVLGLGVAALIRRRRKS